MTTQAILHTNLGDITVNLFPDHAPKTVANFTGLAEGTIEWTDPKVRAKSTAPLYDNTIFHRIIPGFMIQGVTHSALVPVDRDTNSKTKLTPNSPLTSRTSSPWRTLDLIPTAHNSSSPLRQPLG